MFEILYIATARKKAFDSKSRSFSIPHRICEKLNTQHAQFFAYFLATENKQPHLKITTAKSTRIWLYAIFVFTAKNFFWLVSLSLSYSRFTLKWNKRRSRVQKRNSTRLHCLSILYVSRERAYSVLFVHNRIGSFNWIKQQPQKKTHFLTWRSMKTYGRTLNIRESKKIDRYTQKRATIIKFHCDSIKIFTRLKAITINCFAKYLPIFIKILCWIAVDNYRDLWIFHHCFFIIFFHF